MILVSSCICLCPIYWIQVLSREWRCSWSSADRRCSNYNWVINNLIAYKGAAYIRDWQYIVYIYVLSLTLSPWQRTLLRNDKNQSHLPFCLACSTVDAGSLCLCLPQGNVEGIRYDVSPLAIKGPGVGLRNWFPPLRYIPDFSPSSKYLLPIQYLVNIWQLSSPLRCGDACQIWIGFRETSKYFWDVQHFPNMISDTA